MKFLALTLLAVIITAGLAKNILDVMDLAYNTYYRKPMYTTFYKTTFKTCSPAERKLYKKYFKHSVWCTVAYLFIFICTSPIVGVTTIKETAEEIIYSIKKGR